MNIALPGPRWFPRPSLCVLQSRSVPGPDTKNDSMMHAIRSTKGRASDDPPTTRRSKRIRALQAPYMRREDGPTCKYHSCKYLT